VVVVVVVVVVEVVVVGLDGLDPVEGSCQTAKLELVAKHSYFGSVVAKSVSTLNNTAPGSSRLDEVTVGAGVSVTATPSHIPA